MHTDTVGEQLGALVGHARVIGASTQSGTQAALGVGFGPLGQDEHTSAFALTILAVAEGFEPYSAT
ncbi:hypothetical protein A5714_12285 [Mycobacterium sp. E2462]|nr:hypothetical protein A5714_12285 [Mycobacterium sp. E2462]